MALPSSTSSNSSVCPGKLLKRSAKHFSNMTLKFSPKERINDGIDCRTAIFKSRH